ncbi:unnamed protein product [Ambrosiozyma monospora]|uniref:Unnamed protein product n=1 Tax=Ambrosiozyma monospora TaxID=43982 RepID=A0A9W6YWR2_AMBMO|nr:unnamed protein product [Ambrosiozyma monospora]
MFGLRRSTKLALLVVIIFGITALSSNNKELRYELTEEANHLRDQINSSLEQLTKSGFEKSIDNLTPPEEGKKDESKEEEKEIVPDPCTVVNPLTNQFFDLSSLSALSNEGVSQPWFAQGFDYGRNFSIGICSTPLRQPESLQENDFTDISNKTEVGAWFSDGKGNKISIGQVSTTPKFRGRKMVLEYEGGSFCSAANENGEKLRKTTLLSFTCDREIMTKAKISYVGSSNDCSYFFEVRTVHACATAAKEDDSAIIWIFLSIVLSAVGVYFCGGLLYTLVKRLNKTPTHLKLEV